MAHSCEMDLQTQLRLPFYVVRSPYGDLGFSPANVPAQAPVPGKGRLPIAVKKS